MVGVAKVSLCLTAPLRSEEEVGVAGQSEDLVGEARGEGGLEALRAGLVVGVVFFFVGVAPFFVGVAPLFEGVASFLGVTRL